MMSGRSGATRRGPIALPRVSRPLSPTFSNAEARKRVILAEAKRRNKFRPGVHYKFRLSDLMIRNEKKQVVPLVPNEVQEQYLDKIAPGWRVGDFKIYNLREIVLKARKQGFSTLILALIFLDTINNENTYSVVLAHDTDSTIGLFQIVKLFYERLPEKYRPVTQYANRREYFWPSLNSRFFVGTAGADDFGRGSTVNNVHGSEVASWPDGDEIATGLMQAVPEGGCIFLESTAKGVGNFFYEEYTKAKDGLSALRNHFVAWFESSKYSKLAPRDFVPTDDEQKLIERYGLNFDQLQWRRDKKREPKMDTDFVQEFPANEDEAFIASGNPYFNNERLADIKEALKRPEFAPLTVLEALEVLPTKYTKLRLELARCEGKEGAPSLRVWRVPVQDRDYIITADTSEGLSDDGTHTFDSADVWDAETHEQVAHLYGLWDTNEYGLMLAELGWWYNIALVAPERNNHGHAVINAMLNNAEYPEATDDQNGLYLHQEFDKYKAIRTRERGWPTKSTTRTFALDELAAAVLQNEIHLRCPETISEMMKFVKKSGGKSGGEGKSRDDRVMSAAIGAALLKAHRPIQQIAKPKPWGGRY